MSNYFLTQNGELYHYGVKGMKWGVRRYRNDDGSLTDFGKKRIAKKYDKEISKVNRKLQKQYNSMYIHSYNKAANDMNNGEIEKFNANQRKKYGDNFANRDGYISDYSKLFNTRVAKYMDTSLNNFYKNDKNFQRSEKLINEYGMTEWHELARKNSVEIDDLRRAIKSGKHG